MLEDSNVKKGDKELQIHKPLSPKEKLEVSARIRHNLYHIFPFLHNEFHQFNYNMDVNLNRFPNNLVEMGDQYYKLFTSNEQAELPEDVIIPPVNDIIKEKIIDYHPIKLSFKHNIDFLFSLDH